MDENFSMYAIELDAPNEVFSVRVAPMQHDNRLEYFDRLTDLVERAIQLAENNWTLLPNVEAR